MGIKELWEEANANPGVKVKIGSTVVCDVCDKDYTDSPTSGGFIFGSYAYCPDCADRGFKKIHEYGEEHLIRRLCPEEKSFADFVREYRGEDAHISVSGM